MRTVDRSTLYRLIAREIVGESQSVGTRVVKITDALWDAVGYDNRQLLMEHAESVKVTINVFAPGGPIHVAGV